MAGPKERNTPVAQPLENPLLPHRVLRQMYRCMLDLQQLEKAIGESRSADRSKSRRVGCEAALASLAASLQKGDLLCEAGGELGLGMLRQTAAKQTAMRGVVELPPMAVATERLLMAVGAGVAAKAARRAQVLVVTVAAAEVAMPLWQQMLGFVARLELPMLFLVLPGGKLPGEGRLSAQSAAWGVPGFPVDASDAPATYRVVQESMGRLRAGGGPVLVECIRWRLAGKSQNDPVSRMRDLLRARGIAAGDGNEP